MAIRKRLSKTNVSTMSHLYSSILPSDLVDYQGGPEEEKRVSVKHTLQGTNHIPISYHFQKIERQTLQQTFTTTSPVRVGTWIVPPKTACKEA